MRGYLAWVLWLVVHLFYLVGFRNRVTVVMHWAVSFLGNARSKRTVTPRQTQLGQTPGEQERSVGPVDLAQDDIDQGIEELTASTVYFGHGDPSTAGTRAIVAEARAKR